MTTRTLRIAKHLTLPLDAVTQTIAILAKRRAGKSYTMRRLVEQLVHAGQQVVIVDPKGDQWGIRSAADGKHPGLAIVILGGERGDVPLEPSGGEVVAKLVVEERVSVLLDVSLFRKHEVATFMTAFLENLYRLKAKEIYRTPMMLVIDEADAIAPQKPQKGEERMLGAAEDIVRRGGQRGIGCVLVTQRSAVLNKNVLTQAQMLVALRTIAPQDLAAMNAWIDVHGTLEQKQTLMESLPSLPIGDAWFWSPGWPTTDGIFKRVHVLPIETFDSGATPKSGEKHVEPKKPADVDLKALQRQMAATIEKAKNDDPRELRKTIAALKADLAKKPASTGKTHPADTRTEERAGKIAELKTALTRHRQALEAAMKILVKVKAIDFAVTTDEERKALEQAVAAAVKQITAPIEKRVTALAERVEGFKLAAKKAEAEITALLAGSIDLTVQVQKREAFEVQKDRPPKASREPRARRSAGDGTLPAMHRAMLIALAQHPDGLTKKQIHVHTGYASSGSTSAAFADLAREGWTAAVDGNRLRITPAGLTALGDFEPLPIGDELRQYLLTGDKLSTMEKALLERIADVYPEAIAKGEILQQAKYASSGSTSAAFAKLVAYHYAIPQGSSMLKAAEELFT
jgi:hypothetical protein